MYWILSNILILKVIAHGDYCDLDPKNGGYIIQKIDFTRDIEQLQEFVEEVGNTHGGDAPECYELVLKHAREEFSWREGEDCKSLLRDISRNASIWSFPRRPMVLVD